MGSTDTDRGDPVVTDTHMKDVAIFQVRETRIDCDGTCVDPEDGLPPPSNLEWSGVPPSLLSLVERAFSEGLPPGSMGRAERGEIREAARDQDVRQVLAAVLSEPGLSTDAALGRLADSGYVLVRVTPKR